MKYYIERSDQIAEGDVYDDITRLENILEGLSKKEAEFVRGTRFLNDSRGIYVQLDEFLTGIPQRISNFPIKEVTIEQFERATNTPLAQYGLHKKEGADAWVSRTHQGDVPFTVIYVRGDTLGDAKQLFMDIVSGKSVPEVDIMTRPPAQNDM